MPEYPLPREVTPPRVEPDCLDHPGLAYYRFVPDGLKDDQKAGFLIQLRDRFNAPQGDRPWRDACAFEAHRLAAAADAFRAQGRPVEAFEAATATRLLVGMGYKNALEVGLTFHHPGGFPFLPGTSVKGLCRAWAEQVEEAHGDLLKTVFGTASKDEKEEIGAMIAGSVCFLDALPTRFPRLDVDLLNPHFPDWYGQGEAPGDWQQPRPVSFLTVAPGQPFRFHLVGRTPGDKEAVRQARTWLEQALVELGAGGKTAAGYGYFDLASGTPQPPSSSVASPASAASPSRSAQPVPASTEPPSAAPTETPTEPEKWTDVGRNSTSVPARVVGHQGRMLVVRLHVAGYEQKEFPLGGVNGPDFEVGDWVAVNVANMTRKKKVAQISFHSRLDG